ncbi:kinase-like domain-containing protein [Gloeopeniophorella convolvens]|nr:kinase-like domain-containing protein [Gloeopeniophorella convolvens]
MIHTDHRQTYRRSLSHISTSDVPRSPALPTSSTPAGSVAVRRITLTSKKNWWMVELEEEENNLKSSQPSDDPSLNDYALNPPPRPAPPVHPASPIYNAPRNPNNIFSFPTPAIYSAPPNPTAALAPFAQGSASELFKCVVKRPEVVQLEINGEMQSNALDVTAQFLAELRVYTHVAPHRNLPVFLGCLDGVGMVLEFLEGGTLYDYLKQHGPLSRINIRDYHNQLLDALTHIHTHGLSHGDLSLLNVQAIERRGEVTLKMIDFGRSVSADSILAPPDGDPVDPWAHLNSDRPRVRTEQIFPGTRPFSAPEIQRGECHDARLADAYSFGMVLVCLERGQLVDVKPWDQRKDLYPADLLDGCVLFEGRIRQYLRRWDERRRLVREDMVEVTGA